jgi:tetratricopeptide (TPR) repeat protein
MIPSSVYLGELLHLWLEEFPGRGLQLWSNLFDQTLQRWDIPGCNQLLRELRRLDTETETGLIAYVLHKTGKGTLAAHTGDLETSARIYESVLPVLPKEETGWVLMNLGNVHYLSRQFDQALQFYAQAKAVYEKINFLPGLAKVITNMGCIQRDNGDTDSALGLFQQAFPLIPDGDIETQIINLSNWANTLHISGNMNEAEVKYHQALQIWGQVDAPHLQAQITGNLAMLYLDMGYMEQAIDFLSRDLSIQYELGDFVSQAEALNNLGIAYRKSGQVDLALECYQRSAEIKSSLGDKLGELTILRNYIIVASQQTLPIPKPILVRAVHLAKEIEDDETLQWLQNISSDFK